jgi:hypothetical protein
MGLSWRGTIIDACDFIRRVGGFLVDTARNNMKATRRLHILLALFLYLRTCLALPGPLVPERFVPLQDGSSSRNTRLYTTQGNGPGNSSAGWETQSPEGCRQSFLEPAERGLSFIYRDIDNDGDVDLIIKRPGLFVPVAVWINDGQGCFIAVDPADFANPDQHRDVGAAYLSYPAHLSGRNYRSSYLSADLRFTWQPSSHVFWDFVADAVRPGAVRSHRTRGPPASSISAS